MGVNFDKVQAAVQHQEVVQATNAAITIHLEQVEKDRRITPAAIVTSRLDSAHAKDVQVGGRSIIAALQSRGRGDNKVVDVVNVEQPLSQGEVNQIKTLVEQVAASTRGRETPYNNLPANARDKALNTLINTAITDSLGSISQQVYLLDALDKLLEYTSDNPRNFDQWGKTNHYKHYISNDEGQSARSPKEAMKIVCARVCYDLESEDAKLSVGTAKDIGALLTAMAKEYKQSTVAEAKRQKLSVEGDKDWDKNRKKINVLFRGANKNANYAKMVPGDSGLERTNGRFSASLYGPSYTVWNTIVFLETCLKVPREAQKVYATAQAADWATSAKYNGVLKGKHTPVEALMTFTNAVDASTETAHARETLLRLVKDNIHVENGEIKSKRKDASSYDETTHQLFGLKASAEIARAEFNAADAKLTEATRQYDTAMTKAAQSLEALKNQDDLYEDSYFGTENKALLGQRSLNELCDDNMDTVQVILDNFNLTEDDSVQLHRLLATAKTDYQALSDARKAVEEANEKIGPAKEKAAEQEGIFNAEYERLSDAA